MFRKEALLEVGGFNTELKHWEDWALSSLISKKHEIVFWDTPVLHYRQHEAQNTKQSGLVSAQAYRDIVLDVWANDKQFAQRHPELLTRMFKLATLRNARYATNAGEYERARADLRRYIARDPKDRRGYTALARNLFRDLILDRVLR
jgi:hypothetical protein